MDGDKLAGAMVTAMKQAAGKQAPNKKQLDAMKARVAQKPYLFEQIGQALATERAGKLVDSLYSRHGLDASLFTDTTEGTEPHDSDEPY